MVFSLIRGSIGVGRFPDFRQGIIALKYFGQVGDFIEGSFQVVVKTEKGLDFKEKFKPIDSREIEALKKGKVILSSLA